MPSTLNPQALNPWKVFCLTEGGGGGLGVIMIMERIMKTNGVIWGYIGII